MSFNKAPGACIAAFAMLSILAACGKAPDTDAVTNRASDSGNLPLKVLTVNYPLQYFVQRIGGEFVEALYPGPVDADPAYWQPDTETLIDYQQADLIVINGAGYANWVRSVSLPLASQVDTSTGFTELLLPVAEKVAHTHGPAGEHVHDELAFTVWLDPELARLQAVAIHTALVELSPEQQSILDANLVALSDDLSMLDEELFQTFASLNRKQIIYSHPVYQYLDRRYELNGISVHWEPDVLPAEKEFEQLAAYKGALMIWESAPLPETIDRLEVMGIQSAVFDPVATQPDSGDYLSKMRDNLQSLKAAVL